MLHQCFDFVTLLVLSVLVKGTTCFFVKELYKGKCVNDTGLIQSSGSWGNLSFLELSENSCLDSSAQFRFRDNGAMLNLKRQGCVAAFNRNGSGYNLNMFYLFVDSVSLDTNACAQKPNESIYRAITQSYPEGGLSVYYKGKGRSSFETWWAQYSYSYSIYKMHGISTYIGLEVNGRMKRFYFGSVTCYGKTVVNANCPKDQYMLVNFASYRGLPAIKKCGLSDDYICKIDVTCVAKKKCDGLHECNLTVDEELISYGLCPDLSNYLYFEYLCSNAQTPYKKPCVEDVILSDSPVPYKGVLQITVDNKTTNVCSRDVDKATAIVACRHLGYQKVHSFRTVPFPMDIRATKISYLNCVSPKQYLSQCVVSTADSKSCLGLPYIECGSFKLLLDEKQAFPDSAFSSSAASSRSQSALNARSPSGSSWCAPAADGKHYLQVDLGRLYHLDYLITYGDSTSRKWVATYNLNYTTDLINWKTVKALQGNKNAFNQVAEQFPNVITRALRLIPLTYVGKPCMRVDFGGETVFPNKPVNLSVTDITSRSAKISWFDPPNQGIFNLSQFWIKLKNNNSLFLNITTHKVNEYQIGILTPSTTYEISLTAGNSRGFGQEFAVISFSTPEEAPSGTPLSIKTASRSESSLFIIWNPPEKNRRNGIIVSYTACISHSEDGPCVHMFITSKRNWLVGNLNASTIYYVRVLASTKVGPGNYSESKGFFTNGRSAENVLQTSRTLTFSLEIPTKTFLYFYVVALKLTNAQELTSPDNYEDIDLVTYDGMQNRTNPRPYVAAVFTSSSVDGSTFILGDGTTTDDPTTRTTSDFFNGPLEPGTSYRIFQRIVVNKQGDFYSTDWSFAAKTSENTVDTHGPEKYVVVIVGILAILLVISLLVIAFLVYQSRFKSQTTTAGDAGQETTDGGSNSENVHDHGNSDIIDASRYEQVGDEQFYSGLNWSGVDGYDDRSYAHLNQVTDVNVMQEETGI